MSTLTASAHAVIVISDAMNTTTRRAAQYVATALDHLDAAADAATQAEGFAALRNAVAVTRQAVALGGDVSSITAAMAETQAAFAARNWV